MAKIEKDLTSPEVRATIEENFKLAEAMGMNGTPSYVIGKQVVIGAVGRGEPQGKNRRRALRQGDVLSGQIRKAAFEDTKAGCPAGFLLRETAAI